MAMCEDYPCCGHDFDRCPTEDGPVCVSCGAQLEHGARSSLCGGCQRQVYREMDEEMGWYPDEYDDEE